MQTKGQHFWVLSLFAAVVLVVLGSMAGAWLSIGGFFENLSVYSGHQGYEFIEQGRVWQVLLIAGMVIWLVPVLHSIAPALKNEDDKDGLTHMLLYSTVAIPIKRNKGLSVKNLKLFELPPKAGCLVLRFSRTLWISRKEFPADAGKKDHLPFQAPLRQHLLQ